MNFLVPAFPQFDNTKLSRTFSAIHVHSIRQPFESRLVIRLAKQFDGRAGISVSGLQQQPATVVGGGPVFFETHEGQFMVIVHAEVVAGVLELIVTEGCHPLQFTAEVGPCAVPAGDLCFIGQIINFLDTHQHPQLCVFQVGQIVAGLQGGSFEYAGAGINARQLFIGDQIVEVVAV